MADCWTLDKVREALSRVREKARLGGGIGPEVSGVPAFPHPGTADAEELSPEPGTDFSARAPPNPADWKECPDCRIPMEFGGSDYVCGGCGRVAEGPVEEEQALRHGSRRGADSAAVRTAPALRMVGPDRRAFQFVLDRHSVVASPENQAFRDTYQELQTYNKAYVGRGGRAFPLNVLREVAEVFSRVKNAGVLRNNRKKRALAVLTLRACTRHGDVRRQEEAAGLYELNNNSIASGAGYLAGLAEQRPELGLDPHEDTLEYNVRAALTCLGYGGELRPMARTSCEDGRLAAVAQRALPAAVALAQLARKKRTAVRFRQNSVAVAAAFEVLIRAGEPVEVSDAAAKRCSIRKNTLVSALGAFRDHHPLFADLYRAWGLDSAPPAAPRRRLPSSSCEAGTGGRSRRSSASSCLPSADRDKKSSSDFRRISAPLDA